MKNEITAFYTAFEGEIIRQCAPTLAGIKIANLFVYTFASNEDYFRALTHIRRIFSPKDIYLEVLRYDIVSHKALLFVYRSKGLQGVLGKDDVQIFFQQRGFIPTTCPLEIIEEMAGRLHNGQDFPHEIGLLLGYPLDEVKAYIDAPHAPGLCAGCWKAYKDPYRALGYFEKCRCCIRAYLISYYQGKSLEQLTLAV